MMRVSGWSGSGEVLFLVGAGVFTASSHGGEQRREAGSSCGPYQGTNPLQGGPTLMTSSNASYLLRSHLLVPPYWGRG